MMHRRFVQRLAQFIAPQRREDRDTVGRPALGYLAAGHIRAGRHQVDQTDGLIADRAGLDDSRPARQQRLAMAALPDVRLLPAPWAAGAVAPVVAVEVG